MLTPPPPSLKATHHCKPYNVGGKGLNLILTVKMMGKITISCKTTVSCVTCDALCKCPNQIKMIKNTPQAYQFSVMLHPGVGNLTFHYYSYILGGINIDRDLFVSCSYYKVFIYSQFEYILCCLVLGFSNEYATGHC